MDYGPEWGGDSGYCAQGGKVSTCLLKEWREQGGRVGLIASQVLKKWELKCTEQVDNKAAPLQSQLTMLGSRKCCGRSSDHGEMVRAFLLGSVVCWPKCVTFCFDGGFALTSELFVAKSYEHSLWINHLKKMDEPVTRVVFRSVDPKFEKTSLRFQVLTFCHHDFHMCLFFLIASRHEEIQEHFPGGWDLLRDSSWKTWWKTYNLEMASTPYGNISRFCPLVSLPHPSSALDPALQAALL